jgi:benzoate transport
MAGNPVITLEEARMHPRQWVAVALMIALNALDGFDVLASAFAAPGIAKEWGIDRAALGIVLSAELIGMGFGSILLGGIADKYGRRPTMLGCLFVMTIGMWLATTAASPTTLAIWRFVTGLGIGGMLAAINAVTAETSNLKSRSFAMSLMVIGYPIGATVGGIIAALLLREGDWRDVFEFGAIATMVFIPLVWIFVPETVAFLNQKRPPEALARINAVLGKFGHAPVDAMPAQPETASKASVFDILKPDLIRTTMLLTIAYSFHAITFYFILKWAPKIVADFGFTPAQAAGVLVWANVGGATGGAIFGLFMHKFGIKIPTMVTLAASALFVAAFGMGQSSLAGWSAAVFICGLATNASIVGLYSAFAKGFPTHVRATGTGFAIGAGRVGAAGSPILAGYLFAGGLTLQTVAIIMALGSLVALFTLSLVDMREKIPG